MLNGDFHQNTLGSKATDSREIWILIPGAARPTAPATQQPRLSLSAEPLCRESDTTVGATVSIVTARFRTPMRGECKNNDSSVDTLFIFVCARSFIPPSFQHSLWVS